MVWLLFFDKNNLMVQADLQNKIDAMEEEKAYYDNELETLDEQMEAIQVDRERYAREVFYLHKKNEIVYIIR